MTPYEPDPIGEPTTLAELTAYMKRELERVQNQLKAQETVPVLSVEPTKKHEFMLVGADGVNWDPGQGKGLYVWFSGRWNPASAVASNPLPEPEPEPEPDPDLSAAGRAVSTFHSISVYWTPPAAPTGGTVPMQYKRVVDGTWKDAHPMWYDARNNECRGSIVHLASNTEYDVRFGMPSQPMDLGLRQKTWNETFPEDAAIETSGAGVLTAALKITAGGSATAYKVYRGHPSGTTIRMGETAIGCIEVRASHVIIRDFNLEGGKHAIWIGPGVHDVVIELNDISLWGQFQASFGGIQRGQDRDSAVYFRMPHDGQRNPPDRTVQRIIIQRNKMYNPKYGANSWDGGHPAGPQAVTLWETGGNHVIRYNEIYSDFPARRFNDGLSGGENFSTHGFPGADSDVYQNIITDCWDDAIECEGGNCNVRVWGNYTDWGAASIGATSTQVGPLYVFRNVYNRSRMREAISADINTSRGRFAKMMTNGSWGRGQVYLYHNTMLQLAPIPPLQRPQGAEIGISGGTGQPLTQTKSRNNILHVFTNTSPSIRTEGGTGNDMNYDLYNGALAGTTGMEANGIKVDPTGQSGTLPLGPIYKAGHGPEADGWPLGKYQLEPASPGHDDGEVIPNFSDGFLDAAPDMGAHEEGSSDMVFGTTA